MPQASNDFLKKRQWVQQLIKGLAQEGELAPLPWIKKLQRPQGQDTVAPKAAVSSPTSVKSSHLSWPTLQQNRFRCPICYPKGRKPLLETLEPPRPLLILWLVAAPVCQGSQASDLLLPDAYALLLRMSQAMGLQPNQWSISSLWPWPVQGAYGLAGQSSLPPPCWLHLQQQWEWLAPKYVLSLGELCSQWLIQRTLKAGAKVPPWSRRCRQLYRLDPFNIRCLPEPATLLQQPGLKQQAWQSLQAVMADLSKQR